MSLVLYIANKNYSSWSLRPWLLMHTLGIPFTEKLEPFAGESSAQLFKTFSPSGKVPCLVDGATIVWDSLAIIEYLAERYSAVWPNDRLARAWARSASAEMHSGFTGLRSICSMNCGVRVKLHSHPGALLNDLKRIDELWSEGLTRFGGGFLAGPAFTAVDAFYAPVVFRIHSYGLDVSPPATAYAQRLLALPAMQRWYADALQERWRDTAHEQDALNAGSIIRDDRVKP